MNLKNLLIFIFILFITPSCIFSAKVSGLVIDDFDNLIIGADLKFVCDNMNLTFPTKSNNFGSFEIDNIYNNNCRIFASAKERVGFYDLEITENKLYQFELILNKKIIVNNNNNNNNPETNISKYVTLFLILLLFLIIIFFFFKIKKTSIKTKYKSNLKSKKINFTNRMHDLMHTLNENETKIVNYLIEHQGVATSSKIRRETNLPKTSFFRWIYTLENKNILKSEEFGNSKKLNLTDFFLYGK